MSAAFLADQVKSLVDKNEHPDEETLGKAFLEYQRVRAPQVDKIVKMSTLMQRLEALDSPLLKFMQLNMGRVMSTDTFQNGLAKMISGKIMHLAGDNETRLFLLVMLTTTAIGAFVSNTGTVALMLPIVVSMAAKGNISASRLLMPLAFASSLGGMLTLIGTPPNLVIQEALANAGYGTLGFFSFTPVGIIAIAIGIK